MNHTPQIKRAIQFAARKHHGQMRKGAEPLPYITHLFSVALLVAEDGADDDVVTAALLHDVIEDTDTERDEIMTHFNARVADLVSTVTEVQGHAWKARKKLYLDQLRSGTAEALLVALADKIDNIESKLALYDIEGESIHAAWSQPKEEYSWFHSSVLAIAEERLPDHRLTKRLREVEAKERATFS